MASPLLERDRELALLQALLNDTMVGEGRIALISGEAGIGKTTVIERFLAQTQDQRQDVVQTLWAACEALFAPRPLGPLYDIAQQTTAQLRALLDGEAKTATIFAAVLDVLAQRPTVLVIEDVHWADEATLDLIKYLARRIHRTAMLLILTYRDDEIDHDHPLRVVLGDLPARDVTRLHLLSLSEGAVAVLEQHAHRPPGRLHAITGGNPFFVVEALAYDAPGAPASVSDAVLTRMARRSPAARRLLEIVSVVPNQIERWVIEVLDAGDRVVLDECLAAQMLRLDEHTVAFRHELARQAVEGALLPARRQELHAAILRALLERGGKQTPLARLVHHAVQAEDATLTVRFAPEAARQAAAQGAHREAVVHYQAALRYDKLLGEEQRAVLLDELSYELYLTEHMEEAVASCAAALGLWRALDRTVQIGHNLRLLSNYQWVLGRHADAERCALEAVDVLEAGPPGHELAMAYAELARLHVMDADAALMQMWSTRALELAERLQDVEAMSEVLNSMGSFDMNRGDDGGLVNLTRSLELALAYDLEKQVARAHANLAICLVRKRDYSRAVTHFEDGMAYCVEHDIDLGLRTLQGERSRARLDQGDWAGAESDARAVLDVPWASPANRIPAITWLGLAQARVGDPRAQTTLDTARDLALATAAMEYIAPIAAARAEWRWLHEDLASCVVEAEMGLQDSPQLRSPWQQSELTIWLWRSGALIEAPPGISQPYALELAGDWRAAADAWERIGCPYEQALALLGGDEMAQRAALAILESLGAAPAAEIARQRLHERGVRGLPRGPHPKTRANPEGLTRRQLEVLPLIAKGLSNAEIAERLSTSPRTIEHHVSAVLAKLNARSRAEAVRRAYELGLIVQVS
jgi:DNA-binding CsgD family transcriptional regulator